MALKSAFNSFLFKITLLHKNVKIGRLFLTSVKHYDTMALQSMRKKFNEHGSRFVSVQEEMLSDVIKNYTKLKVPDWSNLRINILENGRAITNVNFDAKVIATCMSQKNFDAAKSYIDFIYSNNTKPNIATLGKFLRLYSICYDNKKINEEDENKILKIYFDLQRACPIFDSITGENVIHGLSLTSKWKECLDILESLKLTSKPGGSTYSAIAKAAFLNNEENIGWKILDETIMNNRLPYSNAYQELMKFAESNHLTAVKKIYKLLDFFANNDIHPSKDVTDGLLKTLKKFGFTGEYTEMGDKNYCKVCCNPLQEVAISSKDFEKLKLVFFNNVIIGKNIFNKSTPEELNKFISFITQAERYDMVIDGLNVAYAAGNNQSPRAYAKMISSVVDYFVKDNLRVLVLGRIHMKKWPSEHMNSIRSKADLFLTHNISQDDPYLLYATMASGIGTGFLSRDFMRGHSYLLMDQNLRRLFRRWQQLHQHSLINVEKNGKVHIKYPYTCLPSVQKHRSGWHIPFVSEFQINPPTSLDPPKQWLCIHKDN